MELTTVRYMAIITITTTTTTTTSIIAIRTRRMEGREELHVVGREGQLRITKLKFLRIN